MSPEFGKLCDEYGIERGSYTSAAVRDQNPDVTAFVKRLYSVCLNRQPDRDGWDFWTGRLRAMSSPARKQPEVSSTARNS